MFEIIMQRILAALGASDGLINTMGPSLGMLLAIACGVAAAQFFKHPISWYVEDDRKFSWSVRAVSVVATFGFALILTDSIRWGFALPLSFLAWGFYHASLWVIRRRWPWLEVHPAVGSVEPSVDAYRAKALRSPNQPSGA